jgi:hypothetical protein
MGLDLVTAEPAQLEQKIEMSSREWIKPTLERLLLKDALGLHILVDDPETDS